MNHLILLNGTGDITIGWTEDQSENMRDLIQQKLDEGCSFFVLEPKFAGLFKKKVKVRNICQIKKNEIIVGDASLAELFRNGLVSAGRTPAMKMETLHKSNNVDEILKHDSLVINPIAGG
ncbi:MAG: hypothetical protein DRG78_16040 [Epsilonproteobacteria bacterium]|nr:MAG: hypothetical protein DRG78_16040 [Campylobacterota bacterium]